MKQGLIANLPATPLAWLHRLALNTLLSKASCFPRASTSHQDSLTAALGCPVGSMPHPFLLPSHSLLGRGTFSSPGDLGSSVVVPAQGHTAMVLAEGKRLLENLCNLDGDTKRNNQQIRRDPCVVSTLHTQASKIALSVSLCFQSSLQHVCLCFPRQYCRGEQEPMRSTAEGAPSLLPPLGSCEGQQWHLNVNCSSNDCFKPSGLRIGTQLTENIGKY